MYVQIWLKAVRCILQYVQTEKKTINSKEMIYNDNDKFAIDLERRVHETNGITCSQHVSTLLNLYRNNIHILAIVNANDFLPG